MLYLVRFITAAGLFMLLCFKLWLGSMFLGGFILAAWEDKLGPVDYSEFEDAYFTVVTVVVLGASLVMAAGVSFSGILPWCRNQASATAAPVVPRPPPPA